MIILINPMPPNDNVTIMDYIICAVISLVLIIAVGWVLEWLGWLS